MIHVLSKKNRALLRELVITDFKLRYQGSILGYLWSLLKPLGLFAILYVVFVRFLRFGSDLDYFPIYLLMGIVFWGFFTEATTNGLRSIVARGDLLRKINFPKSILVLSGTVSALINLVINLGVIGVFMIISRVPIRPEILLLPLIIIELYVFTLAVSFFLSAVYVRFRDISHIWEVIMQGAFYAVPIIYPLNLLPTKAAQVLMLNPVAQIVQDARDVAVTSQTITLHEIVAKPLVIVPFAIVVFSIVLASIYFRKNSKYFAEFI